MEFWHIIKVHIGNETKNHFTWMAIAIMACFAYLKRKKNTLPKNKYTVKWYNKKVISGFDESIAFRMCIYRIYIIKHIKLHFNSFSSLGRVARNENNINKKKAINKIWEFYPEAQQRKILLKIVFVLCFAVSFGDWVFRCCCFGRNMIVWETTESCHNFCW